MSDFKKTFDVAVIGSGPAGMTAGLYAARAGLTVAVFEKMVAGGQLGETHLIENYPGFVEGLSGFDLAFNMKQQAERFGCEPVDEEVVEVDLHPETKVITTPYGVYGARSVIVATGARPRKLGLPNEDALTGRGLSYCATCDGSFFRGKKVVIVGGGDTAAADALYLSRICESVTIIYRRGKLRATPIYHKMLEDLENVHFEWFSVVEEALTDDTGALSGVRIKNTESGEDKLVECSGMFMAIGSLPNTEFLKGALALNEQNYIISDELGKTEIPGVFAAGDVRTKQLRQVSTAIADGANTAEQAAEFVGSL